MSYRGLEASIKDALVCGSPAAVRYPSGKENADVISAFYKSDEDYSSIGIKCDLDTNEPTDVLFVTHGRYVREVMRAKAALEAEGTRCGIVLCEVLKPYEKLADDVREVLYSSGAKKIIFCEEEIKAGGFSMMLSEAMRKSGALYGIKYDIVATDDSFVIQTVDEDIYKSANISAEHLVKAYKNLV